MKTEPTIEEKRRLVKADKMIALNSLDRPQLLNLTRALTSLLVDLASDEQITEDWNKIYRPIWTQAMKDIHKD